MKERDNKKFKSLGVNAFLNAFKSSLSVLFPLITYPYAFRILNVEGMGKVNYATSIVSYFSLIATLGVSSYAVREGAKLRNKKEELEKFSNQIFSLNLFTAFIAYAALAVSLVFVQQFSGYRLLIVLSSLTILFTTLGVEWLNTIYEDYLYITIRSIITHVISLILLFLLVKNQNDYYAYAMLNVVSTAVVCILNWFYCRKYVKLRLTRKIAIKKHIKPILTLFANSIATTIYVSADTTMLGWMCGDYYVGIYSIAVKIYNVVKQMLAAMYLVTVPRISYFIGVGEFDNVKSVFTKLLSNIMLILLPSAVGLMTVSREVILLMGGEEYRLGIPTLQILSIALIGAIFGGIITYCLNIPLGRERYNVQATSISAVVNVVLNFFLIPIFKQNGAAITTLIAEFLVLFYCLYQCKDIRNYVDAPVFSKNMVQTLAGCVVMVAVNTMISHFCSVVWMRLIIKIAAGVLTYGGLLVALKNELAISLLEKVRRRIQY